VTDDGRKDVGITYSSSDTGITEVNSAGEVKPIKTGTTYITAKTNNGLATKYKIVIKNVPTKITLTNANFVLKVGDTVTLKPAVGKGYYASYSFTSNNESVVTVSKSGKITTKKAGSAIITIKTHNGLVTTCEIRVKAK
jgi:uncharacterized protein YjdB